MQGEHGARGDCVYVREAPEGEVHMYTMEMSTHLDLRACRLSLSP